jgi:hypothetical protein
MAQNAVDRARARWGIDQQTPVSIDGAGDGNAFDDARNTAHGLMPQLVSLDGVVRKSSLAELDALLTSFGLELLKSKTKDYNAPGRMLFYQRGRLLVRIKTKGNLPNATYRANQPHLSVGLMRDDQDLAFESEVVKFSPAGRARPKSTDPRADRRTLLPVTGTVNNPKYDGDEGEWARSTHFNFAPGLTILI